MPKKKAKKRGWSTSIECNGFESNPFIDGFLAWWDSPEGELCEEILEIAGPLLKNVDVDARNRALIWDNGKRLSIGESARRIHRKYPELPLDLIEEHVIAWLEMDYAPESYSPEQLDELDRLTEAWIDDHYARSK